MELWDIYNKDGLKTGETSVRGNNLSEGQYHLVVQLCIRNKNGDYLISRRSKYKEKAGQLETIGGSAIKGEDSIDAIIRETKEELGTQPPPTEVGGLGLEAKAP